MTDSYYYEKWWIKPFIKSLGAYPIKSWGWSLEDVLASTIKKLQENNTVMIFPEGQIVRKRQKVNPKPGVAYIVSKQNPLILPIRIEGLKDKSFWKVLKDGNVVLKIGEARKIKYNKKNINLQQKSREVMKMVYRL